MLRPVTLGVEHGVINPTTSVFYYGCGRGGDVALLRTAGFAVFGRDPAHAPDSPRLSAGVVNLGYVLNVIADPTERVRALSERGVLPNMYSWSPYGCNGRSPPSKAGLRGWHHDHTGEPFRSFTPMRNSPAGTPFSSLHSTG
jgi:hypothetical protein